MDPEQARCFVGPDLDPNYLTLWYCSWKKFPKKLILKTSADEAWKVTLHAKTMHNLIYIFAILFCLIWCFASQSTIFQLCREVSCWVEQVQTKDKCVCSKTQHSDAGETRTRGPSVSSQALYHCAPILLFSYGIIVRRFSYCKADMIIRLDEADLITII